VVSRGRDVLRCPGTHHRYTRTNITEGSGQKGESTTYSDMQYDEDGNLVGFTVTGRMEYPNTTRSSVTNRAP